ncbi:hypothetical protein NQ314_012809, partial [Rhamnusium bicolor]
TTEFSLIQVYCGNNWGTAILLNEEKGIFVTNSHVIINRNNDALFLGDSVYSAGFSLFSKECQPSPTISKGCISQNNPYMLRTTCCVHPGASGGAILDDDGALLGIIVCNTKLHEHNTVYPRVNMAIPFSVVEKVIFKYIQNGGKYVNFNANSN